MILFQKKIKVSWFIAQKGFLEDEVLSKVPDVANKYYLLFEGGLKNVKTKQDFIEWGYVPDIK